MKIGPIPFWVISPFGGAQLWTYYCVLWLVTNNRPSLISTQRRLFVEGAGLRSRCDKLER